jgi:hypothetical protein
VPYVCCYAASGRSDKYDVVYAGWSRDSCCDMRYAVSLFKVYARASPDVFAKQLPNNKQTPLSTLNTRPKPHHHSLTRHTALIQTMWLLP